MNLRPSGYEPDELPDCSTPRREVYFESMRGVNRFRKIVGLHSVGVWKVKKQILVGALRETDLGALAESD